MSRLEKRWESGKPHHPKAEEIIRGMARLCPELDLKFGGDGDNGEDLIMALSIWIEAQTK